MYTILGADGKEYGPVSADDIRQWMAQGRANSETKVRVEGTTEWKRIADLHEFDVSRGRPAGPAVSATGMRANVDAVAAPAIGLIATAALGLVLQLLGLLVPAGIGGEQQGLPTFLTGSFGFGSPVSILTLGATGVILYGALKMKKRESRNWAMAASVLALIPLLSPCCLIGLPIGIWSLVILSKPEVKQSFT
jgi:hypothetical protein